MSQSDSGETTDSSGSISDWALVNEDGHLQDDDTVSTGSSVEVMEEEEVEEGVDPITPVAGNSPQGTVVQPLFVLRLSSHEVSDTDEENTMGTRESVSDSHSTDETTDMSSGIPSSIMSEESLVETSSLDSAMEASTSDVKPDLGRAVSQEDIDSLRRAIDDVQSDLLQSQAVSSSMSSFEMFDRDMQDSGCHPPSTSTTDPSTSMTDPSTSMTDPSTSTTDPSTGMTDPSTSTTGPSTSTTDPSTSITDPSTSTTGQSNSTSESSSDTGETDTLPRPPAVTNAAKGDNSGEQGTLQDGEIVSPADSAEARGLADREVETLGPDSADERQVVVWELKKGWVQKMFQWFGGVFHWWRQMRQGHDLMPWFLGSYILLMSVLVCVVGLMAYYTIAPGMSASKRKDDFKVPVCPTENWRTSWMQCRDQLEATKAELEVAANSQGKLKRRLQMLYAAGDSEKERYQTEYNILVKQFDSLQQELQVCKAQLAEYDGTQDDGGTWRLKEEPGLVDDLELNQPESLQGEDQSAGKRTDQSKKNEDQSAKKEDQSKRKSPRAETVHTKHTEAKEERRQRKKEKDRQARKEKGRQDSADSDQTETPESGEEFSESDNSSGRWMDNIFDIVNKTKGQIQETWVQVRNISDNLWKQHSPALERLQNKFAKKFQHLSDKLQRKIEKRTRKWFGRKTTSDDDKETKHKDKTDEARVKTKRRQYRENESEKKMDTKQTSDPHIIVTTMCDPRLMELSRKIKTLNANKYKKLSNQDRQALQCKAKNILQQLSGDVTVQTDDVLSEWLRCQKLWWDRQQRPTVGKGCENFLSCWQVKLSNGAVKKCRKLKMENGNILDGRCPVGPVSEEDVWLDKGHHGQDITGDRDQLGDTEKQTLHDCNNYSEEEEEDHDYDDDLWYIARAEGRQYHRDMPDDWYFRRLRHLDSPPVYPKTYADYENDVEEFWMEKNDL